MKRITTLLFCAALAASVQAQSFSGKPFLSVAGHAETRVRPDVFPLDVTLLDTSMDAQKSQKIVEDLAKLVLAEAKKLNLADVDIEIGNLSIEPQFNEKDDEEIFIGNKYERDVNIRFHDLDSLRAFIAALPDSRNLRLETRSFEYSKAAELKRQLRREAIEDAKRGAQDMAAAVGKRLLDLQNVSDRAQSTVYSASGYSYNSEGLDRVTVVGNAITPRRSSEIVLREGEIKISSDAYLVYLIGD
jgi:uncharacterized protein YggE